MHGGGRAFRVSTISRARRCTRRTGTTASSSTRAQLLLSSVMAPLVVRLCLDDLRQPLTDIRTVQILPQLQPKAKKLTTYIRNKTCACSQVLPLAPLQSESHRWIALPLTSGGVRQRAQEAGMTGDDVLAALYQAGTANPPYPEEQKKTFASDSQSLYRYRKAIENENNGRFASSVVRPDVSGFWPLTHAGHRGWTANRRRRRSPCSPRS